jgi:hypothetical protein
MNLPLVQNGNTALSEKADHILSGWLVESCPSEASRVIYRNDLKHFSEYLNAAAIATEDTDAYLFRPFNKRGGTLQSKPLHDYMIRHIVKKYAGLHRAAG